jgi:hypothetical protein
VNINLYPFVSDEMILLEDVEEKARAMNAPVAVVEFLESTIAAEKWTRKELNFLRILQWDILRESSPDLATQSLEAVVTSVLDLGKVRLDEDDAMQFFFALGELEWPLDDKVKQMVIANSDLIKVFFPNHNLLSSVSADELEKPLPPRPMARAPPKPVTTSNLTRVEIHRALPGYTPGSMAEEYARKHNL